MHGYLVLADISGYTQFLTEGELEHAHGVITDLLDSIISAIKAPLAVSAIEGDAVFMYGESGDLLGQTVLESVESLYVAFSSALEAMVLNTTCKCNACANINGLGLKIVMHCGEFLKSNVGGNETLTGPDVIAVHRLLKNSIREMTGIADYLLVTETCAHDLELERVVAAWVAHTEDYEHVGTIKGYVSSLKEVWEFVQQQRSIKIVEAQAWLSFTGHTTAPPAVVWDQLIDPLKRNAWMGADTSTIHGDVDGRIGPGTEYHCAHGEEINVFAVVDSRPGEYMTMTAPFIEGSAFLYTTYLIPSGSGTRVVTYLAAPTWNDAEDASPLEYEPMSEFVAGNVGSSFERMYLASDAAAAAMASA